MTRNEGTQEPGGADEVGAARDAFGEAAHGAPSGHVIAHAPRPGDASGVLDPGDGTDAD
jgi:hypothetical protein